MTFRLEKIDHLGLAVRDLDAAEALWTTLGLAPAGREEVPEQKVEVSFLPVGESAIELLRPTAPDSPIAKFLESRGEGLHHVCYRVDDIDAALAALAAAGLRLIHPTAVTGAHGARVAFLHPKDTGGLLVELKEVASP